MLVPGREIDRARPGAGGNDIYTVLRRRGLILHQHAVTDRKRDTVDGHGAGKRSDVRGRGALDRRLGVEPLNSEIDIVLGGCILGGGWVRKSRDALAVNIHRPRGCCQLVEPVCANPGVGEVEVSAFGDVAG